MPFTNITRSKTKIHFHPFVPLLQFQILQGRLSPLRLNKALNPPSTSAKQRRRRQPPCSLRRDGAISEVSQVSSIRSLRQEEIRYR